MARLIVLVLVFPVFLLGCVLLGLQVDAPSITPEEGTYPAVNVHVYLSCSDADASIHYTTDGTTPTSSSPTCTGSVAITDTTTVKAVAVQSGKLDSAVTEVTYTLVKSGYTLAGTVRYQGALLNTLTTVPAEYAVVQDYVTGATILNTGTGDNTGAVVWYYDPGTSEYAFTNLPSKQVWIQLLFNNVGDQYALPGNFWAIDTPDLSSLSPSDGLIHVFPVQTHVHLLAPLDNSIKVPAGTVFSYPGTFTLTWEALPGAAHYVCKVWKVTDADPYTRAATPDYQVSVDAPMTTLAMSGLATSTSGNRYALNLYAYDSSWNGLADTREVFSDYVENWAGVWFKVP